MNTRIAVVVCGVIGLSNASCVQMRSGSEVTTFSVSHAGDLLAFSAGGDLYLMDLDGGACRRLTKTTRHEASPAFSPDDRSIVFSGERNDSAGYNIFTMDLQTKETRRVTDYGGYDRGPSFSPDGRKVVFVRAHHLRAYSMGGHIWTQFDLYLVGVDGSELTRLSNEKCRSMSTPYFFPDGKRILFSARTCASTRRSPRDSSYPTEIFVFNMETRNFARVIRGGRIPGESFVSSSFQPRVSADGKRIAFVSDRQPAGERYEYDYEIWVSSPDGSDAVQLTHGNSYYSSPFFSPDGLAVYFLDDIDGGIRRVSLDGREVITLPVSKGWKVGE